MSLNGFDKVKQIDDLISRSKRILERDLIIFTDQKLPVSFGKKLDFSNYQLMKSKKNTVIKVDLKTETTIHETHGKMDFRFCKSIIIKEFNRRIKNWRHYYNNEIEKYNDLKNFYKEAALQGQNMGYEIPRRLYYGNGIIMYEFIGGKLLMECLIDETIALDLFENLATIIYNLHMRNLILQDPRFTNFIVAPISSSTRNNQSTRYANSTIPIKSIEPSESTEPIKTTEATVSAESTLFSEIFIIDYEEIESNPSLNYFENLVDISIAFFDMNPGIFNIYRSNIDTLRSHLLFLMQAYLKFIKKSFLLNGLINPADNEDKWKRDDMPISIIMSGLEKTCIRRNIKIKRDRWDFIKETLIELREELWKSTETSV